MKRGTRSRTAMILAIIVFLLVPSLCAAQRVEVFVGDNLIRGYDWPAASTVNLTVKDKNGNFKSFHSKTTSASGFFYTHQDRNATSEIRAGDSIKVTSGGSSHSITIGKTTLTDLDPKGNRIAGRVPSGESPIYISASHTYIIDGGRDWRRFYDTVTPDPDGRFSISTEGFDLKRLDYVSVTYLEGSPVEFEVTTNCAVPGLDLRLGAQRSFIRGPNNQQQRALLLKGRNKVKGVTLTHSDNNGFSELLFTKPNGRTVGIVSGDRVRVAGKWPFTSRVAPLTMTVDRNTEMVHIETLPDTMVELLGWRVNELPSNSYFTVYPVSDADGVIDFTYGGNIVWGDFIKVYLKDRQGNELSRTVQVFD